MSSGLSKEAEMFEKANIVDVGLQPNEFRPRRNSKGSPKRDHDMEQISVNENESDTNEDIKLNIDELEKADNNLVVDEAFQKSLDERANQFAGNQHNLNSFPPIPKPTVEYTYTDKFKSLRLLNEWFTLKEFRAVHSYNRMFTQRFGSQYDSLDYNEKEDILCELMEPSRDDVRRLNNLICLEYITLGAPNESEFTLDLETMAKNVELMITLDIVPWLVNQLKLHYEASSKVRFNLEISSHSLFHCCTILYIIILVSLEYKINKTREQLSKSSFLDILVKFIDSWRWNSRTSMRIRNIIVLLSRSIQLIIGDLQSREKAKSYLSEKYNITKNNDPNKLNSSPVDFHVFRSELISRYPSFVPPPSKLPEEFEQASSLVQFINIQKPSTESKSNAALQDPPLSIHISTPAPSPSSSPSRNSKAKRGFQTNHSYPFIYPIDSEDVIPKSVQEATDLFASSVRYSLSLKQLWSEVGSFVEQERGWVDNTTLSNFNRTFDLSKDVNENINEENFKEEKRALNEVEKFYDHNLPYFSSIVHVLLQIIITSQEDHAIILKKESQSPNILEMIRLKEVVLKESSLILVLLFKWFKISHVLKFENFSAIIYDSNYLGIINQYLKTLGDEIIDRIELNNKLDINFCFTLRNLLTITSKLVSKKVQRVLTLCENDVPSLLRNIFEFYNLELWHPALKLLKEITPFKGKKWKSNNMDLISMVYLHQKLGLRDNWLSGRDVEGEISDAYGQEIALRALVQFYNMKRYPNSMGQLGYKEKPGDFFTRESEIVVRN